MIEMKHAYIALATLMGVFFLTAIPTAHASAPRTEFMPCGYEDSVNCVWDAKHMGNGEGKSFFTKENGKSVRIPHSIAHFLIYGDSVTH